MKYTATGTTIKFKETGSLETAIVLTGCTDITLPDQSYNTIDVSYLDETTGVKQRIKGDINGGDLTFNLAPRANDTTAVAALKAAYLDATKTYDFEVTIPTAGTYTYVCVVTTMTKGQLTRDGLMTYAVTCPCNSLESFTSSAS